MRQLRLGRVLLDISVMLCFSTSTMDPFRVGFLLENSLEKKTCGENVWSPFSIDSALQVLQRPVEESWVRAQTTESCHLIALHTTLKLDFALQILTKTR